MPKIMDFTSTGSNTKSTAKTKKSTSKKKKTIPKKQNLALTNKDNSSNEENTENTEKSTKKNSSNTSKKTIPKYIKKEIDKLLNELKDARKEIEDVKDARKELEKKQIEFEKKQKDFEIKIQLKSGGIISPSQLESVLRSKYNVPNIANEHEMKEFIKNSTNIPSEEAYFLKRLYREKKSLDNLHLLFGKYTIEDYNNL